MIGYQKRNVTFLPSLEDGEQLYSNREELIETALLGLNGYTYVFVAHGFKTLSYHIWFRKILK
jgi:hypothetical protein